jgi:subtilisin family serine protease
MQRNPGRPRFTGSGRPYRPAVVVKLRPEAAAAQAVGAQAAVAGPGGPADIRERIVGVVPGATVEPLFPAVAPQLAVVNAAAPGLHGEMAAAAAEERAGLDNLLGYVRVALPMEGDTRLAIANLRGLDLFEMVYEEGRPTPPPVVAALADRDLQFQGHLDPAPNGIDAEFAWNFPGGTGAGVGLVDVEQGWARHEDLPPVSISGRNIDFFGHGTAVIGVVAAIDNGVGVVGIAPEIGSLAGSSQWRGWLTFSTARAIYGALNRMKFGDVLLLEAQTTCLGLGDSLFPVEVEPGVQDAIRLAVSRGITVVEAAGNGGRSLDGFEHPIWKRSLDRDSGAILVGAATAEAPHFRMDDSNFGQRVDCYAWGEGVTTTGNGFLGRELDHFTDNFGGTSAASAIVAGAAVVVQGIAKANLKRLLSPAELRDLLKNRTINTPSDDPANDLIGVMPDLRAIIRNLLDLP